VTSAELALTVFTQDNFSELTAPESIVLACGSTLRHQVACIQGRTKPDGPVIRRLLLGRPNDKKAPAVIEFDPSKARPVEGKVASLCMVADEELYIQLCSNSNLVIYAGSIVRNYIDLGGFRSVPQTAPSRVAPLQQQRDSNPAMEIVRS
jgi:hypothetical protein